MRSLTRHARYAAMTSLLFALAACGGGMQEPAAGSAVATMPQPDSKPSTTTGGTSSTFKPVVIAWNDLGMHCVDGKDYSVFSILPPYNNLHAQVVDKTTGKLVQNAVLTYQSVADPTGSINTYSDGKTNFWKYVKAQYGVTLAPDMGLAGFQMASTVARGLKFNSTQSWYEAEGIPITPYDDAGTKNYYPMVRVSARDARGKVLASTDVVLPVSDEMSCRSCHASTSGYAAAMPASGWVNYAADSELDWKKNILRLHDEKYASRDAFKAALSTLGLRGTNLTTSAEQGKPVLCAACHGSNALPGTGIAGIPKLTAAVHTLHAGVQDPTTGLRLNDDSNRETCYLCHPGSQTKCLRGVMGNAVVAGTPTMQCQGCHGKMTVVGDSTRTGWLDQPNCQSCHRDGKRELSALNTAGRPLKWADVADKRFATNADKPVAGFSLYRFSRGHGSLQCEACHGSTHAEYPSSHDNDNIQSVALQGHTGTLAECNACHATVPFTAKGGPHGMHTPDNNWVDKHHDYIESSGGVTACAACHGPDYRGSFLSRVSAQRTFYTEHGTKTYAAGQAVSCYDCHNGPNDG